MDGSVVAWDANGQGQLGDGTTTPRAVPGGVLGLSDVAHVTMGDEHGVAVADDGRVWAWGDNGTGALGDGTNTDRPTPVPLAGAALTWLAPTPTLSVAPGTYAAPFAVTVGHVRSDAVLRWTADGATPDESSPTVAVGNTLPVDVSQTLRVRAWMPNRAPSAVAVATYVLQVPAPTASPASGTYTALQTLTVGVPTGATARYTLDGSEPTEGSTAYSIPFVVPTSATVRVRAFRSGWTPSAALARTVTYDLGTLPAPTASPGPGTYTGPQTVTLAATSGATIHYSFVGVGPTSSWPVHTVPLLIDATRTLYAQAVHPDYATSTALVGTYTLPDREWADVVGNIARPWLYHRRPGRKAEPEWSLPTTTCGQYGLPAGRCGVGITDWLEDPSRFFDSCDTHSRDIYKRLRGGQ